MSASYSLPTAPFLVRIPTFEGSLSELLVALHSGSLAPADIPLLSLTQDVLEWVGDSTLIPDLLPPLAQVIALKARLLLLSESIISDDEPDEYEEITQGITALAQLDQMVAFLAGQREKRAHLLAAPAVPVQLPRKERRKAPQRSLQRLLEAAKVVREIEIPLLAHDRLTLSDALQTLRKKITQIKHFLLGDLSDQWAEQTSYFAAVLEGIKEDEFIVEQDQMYGEIRVSARIQETDIL